MLTYKEVENIINDLEKIFGHDTIVYQRADKTYEWLDVTLEKNIEITSNDFPHLLTIAENYGLHISIYVIDLAQLGIFLRR